MALTQQETFLHRPFGRRTFSKGAGEVTLAVAATAAGVTVLSETACSPNPYPEELTKYYPELKRVTLPIQAIDEIPMQDHIPTRVYNLSEYTYNPSAVKAIYDFYETWANRYKAQEEKTLIRHPYDGQDHIFAPMPIKNLYPHIQTRITLIAPPNVPRPSWAMNRLAQTAIEIGGDNDSIFTLIRTGQTKNEIFTTPQESATASFAIEACSQLLATLVFDPQRINVLTSDRDRIRAQEIVANSFGRALGAGLLDIPYEKYVAFITGRKGNIPEQQLWNYSYIVLSEQDYNAIPKAGAILQ